MAGLIIAGTSVALALALNAFQSNLLYFISPSEVNAGQAPTGKQFRVGGLVVQGSVIRPNNDLTVQFQVTDTLHSVPVQYTGILPDLFRDGQGVVVKGKLNANGVFEATEVLAKHDENYMPPEVADALQAAKTMTAE